MPVEGLALAMCCLVAVVIPPLPQEFFFPLRAPISPSPREGSDAQGLWTRELCHRDGWVNFAVEVCGPKCWLLALWAVNATQGTSIPA